ncbi:MAG TPA: amidohydrolase family protein [Acidimicrobiales bacterium]
MGEKADERLIIVSGDSHAGIPNDLWAEYLPERFHDLLPSLRQDNVIYPTAMQLNVAKSAIEGASSHAHHPEHQEAHSTGWHGLHDPVLRLADMDREGIAAEIIYLGDFRLGDLFHNVTNRSYGLEAWEAGAKAWNRWTSDTFGFATDRFLVTAAIGPCVDMDAAVAEIHWIAEHGFVGTYAPGYMTHPDMPPLYDPYWEPFWAACAETGIAIVVHAGYGTEQGLVFPHVQEIYDTVAEAAGSTDREALLAHASAVTDESRQFFTNFSNYNIDSRRPMWQLMLGGVFDRHPTLRFVPSEIRLDWIPTTLAHIDAVYAEHRDEVPAQRAPSDYWSSNCLGVGSFMHKAEVEMRHEIGVENMVFGRDYPHPEGTWPHTTGWLQDAFEGVPDDELRLILGENAIRFFGLDRARLAEIAKRIGPTIDELHAGGPVADDLIASFALRGGYLKPAERDTNLEKVDEALRADLEALAVTGSR